MASQANGATEGRVFQDGARYQLPKDAVEHDRLDGQSAGLVNLMNDQPFRSPLSNPKKILDVGCGTGSMTHLLGTLFPEAEVIGVDLAPVPESRHGNLPNVTYIQGDINDLSGSDPRFAAGSFDYIYQRLLVFGMTDWPGHLANLATLLKSGGWLECHEVDVTMVGGDGKPKEGEKMEWWAALKEDCEAMGINPEIGRRLKGFVSATPGLQKVEQLTFGFPPVMRPGREKQTGLIEQIPALLDLLMGKVCATRRTEEEVQALLLNAKQRWELGFDDGDHWDVFVVFGQKV